MIMLSDYVLELCNVFYSGQVGYILYFESKFNSTGNLINYLN